VTVDAVDLDPNNSQYLGFYAFNEYTRDHYDEAIAYFQKALAVDTVAFKDKHPTIAVDFNNLGSVWQDKGKYDRAIDYFEKGLTVKKIFLDDENPSVKISKRNLSHSINKRGMELFQKKEYSDALPYFQKALENAEAEEDLAFPIICLSNIGSTHNRLHHYAEGLAALEKGIARAEQLPYFWFFSHFQKTCPP